MNDILKKILIGVGVVTVLTIGGLGLTSFIDNRIEAKTTDPIEEWLIRELKEEKDLKTHHNEVFTNI
ncbi:MAG: hypothetical protein M0R46_11495 [Candidatus Muirbacterium halophilum]|nr:hypothetical protein [Candidatus Muirbacterium halophilum]